MRDAWREATREMQHIARDHVSGSAELTMRAAHAVENFLRRSSSLPEDQLMRRLKTLARALLAAQPSMAPMINLANALLVATERETGALRERLLDEIRQSQDALGRMPREIARRFVRLVPRGATVLTYSYSSTVLAALLAAHRAGRKIQVVCSESRPMLEGSKLARRLAQAGVPVVFVVDALLPELVAESDLVVCGADAILADGFVNKVGTRALRLAAAEAGVPFYVLADQTKFLPRRLERYHRVREESADEIWPGRPRRIHVVNRYFELIPWPRGVGASPVLSERGRLTLRQLRSALAARPVAKQLRRT